MDKKESRFLRAVNFIEQLEDQITNDFLEKINQKAATKATLDSIYVAYYDDDEDTEIVFAWDDLVKNTIEKGEEIGEEYRDTAIEIVKKLRYCAQRIENRLLTKGDKNMISVDEKLSQAVQLLFRAIKSTQEKNGTVCSCEHVPEWEKEVIKNCVALGELEKTEMTEVLNGLTGMIEKDAAAHIQ